MTLALAFIAGLLTGAPIAFLAYALCLSSARREASQSDEERDHAPD